MEQTLVYDPLIPMPILMGFAAVMALGVLLTIWRRLPGWWLRALAAMVVLAALANPVLQQEEREGLSNIVFVVSDNSESQKISDRPAQIAEGLEALRAEIGGLENFELREVVVLNDPDDRDSGTMLLSELAKVAADVPASRIAGAILITDGRIHDADRLEAFPAPVHVLQTGRTGDWDRRLVLKKAPSFAILDEEIRLSLRIETLGQVPEGEDGLANIEISIDGDPPASFQVRQNVDLDLPLKLRHGGQNVLEFRIDGAEGELTERNNRAVVAINGVRDRLRVLLVSGEPYSGGRVWRNLLKSDSAVDLVHFTILRSQEKQDGVPVRELSLIAFPTRELFSEKIDEFDLIIFDRYKRRGMLLPSYFRNVSEYVRNGGAVLFTTGPDFAGVNSVYRSGLQDILPVDPTTQVFEEGFLPRVSDVGDRHPVTEGLALNFDTPPLENGDPGWGRWFRQIDAVPRRGDVVMTGIDEKPLLVLDRVDEGRVATLLSDHAWLWNRGYEGGGPQLELLRRLAHWMMKEPELEEEQLTARADGSDIFVTRRSLSPDARSLTIKRPDESEFELEMEETSPGKWTAKFRGDENGIFRLSDGEMETVMAIGPTAPREFENAIADHELLRPLLATTGGGQLRLEQAPRPELRVVRAGRSAVGSGWLGVVDRQAFLTQDIRQTALLPAWAWLILAAALMIWAWRREGRA